MAQNPAKIHHCPLDDCIGAKLEGPDFTDGEGNASDKGFYQCPVCMEWFEEEELCFVEHEAII